MYCALHLRHCLNSPRSHDIILCVFGRVLMNIRMELHNRSGHVALNMASCKGILNDMEKRSNGTVPGIALLTHEQKSTHGNG